MKQKLLQACCAAVSAVLAFKYDRFAGTEFSSGRVSGPMLDMFSIGTLLFALALLTLWMYPRIAAIITSLASLLCFPLYVYFTAPGLFRFIFRGEYSTPLPASFRWDFWAVLGMLALLVTAYVSTQAFFAGEGARVTRRRG
jgi:hypothetical protein